MKEQPKLTKVENVEQNHHGYEGWATYTIRDNKTNVCLAVVGEVDNYFETQYGDIAHKMSTAYNCHAELLEALEAIKILTGYENMDREIIHIVDAAIAKAKG